MCTQHIYTLTHHQSIRRCASSTCAPADTHAHTLHSSFSSLGWSIQVSSSSGFLVMHCHLWALFMPMFGHLRALGLASCMCACHVCMCMCDPRVCMPYVCMCICVVLLPAYTKHLASLPRVASALATQSSWHAYIMCALYAMRLSVSCIETASLMYVHWHMYLFGDCNMRETLISAPCTQTCA